MSLLNLTFYDTGESIVLYNYDEFIDDLPYEFIDNKLIVSIDEMIFELNKAAEDWTKHYTDDEGDE